MANCILGKFLRVVCHWFSPPSDVPTLAASCLYVRNNARDHSSERWKYGPEICPVILPKLRIPRKFRYVLYAAKSTTLDRRLYFPSEGRRAEEFLALKIRRLRLGLNPWTWVAKTSTLTLEHRSQLLLVNVQQNSIFERQHALILQGHHQRLQEDRPKSSIMFHCIVESHNDDDLLAIIQYSESLENGPLDTAFLWFSCVYKQMLRWFQRFQVATTCCSHSPPDLNSLVTNFMFCIHLK